MNKKMHKPWTFVLLLSALAHAAPVDRQKPLQTYQYITLEEHCIPSVLASEIDGNEQLALLINGTFGPTLVEELLDSGEARLESLNKNNIKIQILNNDLFDPMNATAASISNTALHKEFTSAHPHRFKAFCSLAMGDPHAAAQELERCVTKLGFVGGLANAQLPNGSFFDSSVYWPVFAMAAKLDVPFYLHPAFPPSKETLSPGATYAPALRPNDTKTFDDFIAANLASAAWGFEAGAGLSFLRLYAAGLFDGYPNLKIILGHMGEMLPFMLERSDEFLSPLTRPGKSLRQVWAENVWITTSGYFWLNQIPAVLTNTDVRKIMYSIDTPFNKNWQGSGFLEELRASGLVTAEEFEGIAWRNAVELFGLEQ